MSKITNDGLTRSGSVTGCFIAVPIWQRRNSRRQRAKLYIIT